MGAGNISDAVIRRLPRYHRQLELLVEKGTERISSKEIASQLQLNPSQVRQDFNCFGGFGQQGYGYNVPTLYKEIGSILGLTHEYTAVIAGAGGFGAALCKYTGFKEKGFIVKAMFDIDDKLIGKQISGVPILHVDELESYIRDEEIDIGILTLPIQAAQGIADKMTGAGIKGIWNFSPGDIHADVPMKNVHLIDVLLTLSFEMNR